MGTRTTTYNAGDLVLYTDPNTNITTTLYVRLPFSYDPTKPPKPITGSGVYRTTAYSIFLEDHVWNHRYSYRFGDIVYHNNKWWIAQSTTQGQGTYSATNINTPFSNTAYWREITTYVPGTNYPFSLPPKQTQGSLGHIYAFIEDGVIYRTKQSIPAGSNIPLSNTAYFEKIQDTLDYYRMPVPGL